jgi:alpha-glucosidase
MRYIPILDAGIAIRSDYDAYKAGKDKDIFIKIKDHDDLIANVWPKDSVFPDFFNEDTI